MTMDVEADHIYNMLMEICPDMIRPFAEIMLPTAIAQMDPISKAELEAKLVDSQDKPDNDKAMMLIEFAKALGADASMFDAAASMGFEINDEVKALL